MYPKPRIFISVPLDQSLTQTQVEIKTAIIDKVKSADFDPQEFNVSGLPITTGWTFDNVEKIMQRCHGAIILAFSKWQVVTANSTLVIMPTEYNHYEGALALTLDKDTLIIKENGVTSRGIAYTGGGHYILQIPQNATQQWVSSKEFTTQFNAWTDAISNRHHVFFGYSGKAADTANRIIKYLTQQVGVRVRDWQVDFKPAGTILDEIEEASKKTLGGIFLFTKDDELVNGDHAYAAPRDNVVFEAGYFMHAAGKERTLIIREEDAKMPADVGGAIYLDLKDRNNTASIETALRKFIDDRI